MTSIQSNDVVYTELKRSKVPLTRRWLMVVWTRLILSIGRKEDVLFANISPFQTFMWNWLNVSVMKLLCSRIRVVFCRGPCIWIACSKYAYINQHFGLQTSQALFYVLISLSVNLLILGQYSPLNKRYLERHPVASDFCSCPQSSTLTLWNFDFITWRIVKKKK